MGKVKAELLYEGKTFLEHMLDKARQLALLLRPDGDHVPAAPLGDDGLLQHFCIGGRSDDFLKTVPHAGGSGPHFTADIRKLGACAVGDLLLAGDGVGDFFLQEAIGHQGGKQPVQRSGLPSSGGIRCRRPGAEKHPGDIQQFPGIEHAAPIRPGQRGSHILQPRKGGATLCLHHGFGIGCLRETLPHLPDLPGGSQIPRRLLGTVRNRFGRQQLQDRRQFYGSKRFFV